uniref:GPI inositol-deacylase n=1 Tax=Strigamia maritima TaxID=126957 RepID=T1JLC1_STRMM
MAEAVVKKLSAVVLPALLLIGVYDYLTNFESNYCNMTYMYETPEYIPIPLHPDVHKQFPHYKLYLYGEGTKSYDGIPVLFIPGNAGSYKQVRSLASVAYRMSVKYSFHFNYFSVDLNEEYSALYGLTLQAQTEFVHASIKRILKLYQTSKTSSPCSVILVGHSMGG